MEHAVIRCRCCEEFFLGVRREGGDVRPIAGSRCADCGGTEFAVVAPGNL